jgi:hypothetical protein
MEFDIGTILYVVITVIALIIGVIGRKKKPAGTGSPEGSAHETGGSFFESFERAFSMEQAERTVFMPEPDEYEAPEPGEPQYAEKYESPYSGRLETGRGSILEEYDRIMGGQGGYGSDTLFEGERSTETMEVTELGDESDVDFFEIIKDFNASTAIVYSAIINRIDY